MNKIFYFLILSIPILIYGQSGLNTENSSDFMFGFIFHSVCFIILLVILVYRAIKKQLSNLAQEVTIVLGSGFYYALVLGLTVSLIHRNLSFDLYFFLNLSVILIIFFLEFYKQPSGVKHY